MSNNTTKPKTSKNNKKASTTNKKRPISTKHISLPGNREIKMNFVMWVMLITLIFLLILVLITFPNRSIRNHIKALESRDEIEQYCTENELNCSFTVLSDYDIEGFRVSRVAFLGDDFFDVESTDESVSDTNTESSTQKNVYITVQKGQKLDVPE
ncbi:hypothetical protein R2F61_08135 [Mollicutes bacterium LVI A0078]|nr:hypothetical protein RZE84_07910 [Mollicutes bacterium LVI A0075]WOO90682.1 hypothetical protein R2F61_08135 [Mollicutes bacterium LVI A0078]